MSWCSDAARAVGGVGRSGASGQDLTSLATLIGAHSLAVQADGAVRAAGKNNYGQLGDGSTEMRPGPVTVAGLPGAARGAAGGLYHSLFLLGDGSVYAAGANTAGQLGVGSFASTPDPVAVTGLGGPAIAVAAGAHHSLFLRSDGVVLAAGSNEHGQLGDGTQTLRTTPTPVTGLGAPVKAIACGNYHSLFLLESGAVAACGLNAHGSFGDGTTNPHATPVAVANLAGPVARIAAGFYHNLFLLEDGALQACGRNDFGQLGDGSNTQRERVVDIAPPGDTVDALIAGGLHSIFVLSDGSVRVCGYNYFGALGDGTTTHRHTPSPTAALGQRVRSAAGGGYHSLFLLEDGLVVGCGRNVDGPLGIGTTDEPHTPVPSLGSSA